MCRPSCSARRAFSLVELMVVIAIIGMLAGIVAYNVVGVGPEAKRQRANADLSNLRNAIMFYKNDTGYFPVELADLRLDPGVEGWGRTGGGAAYIFDLPLDPWGRQYDYFYPDPYGPAQFNLVSYGRDAQEGGNGEDEDVWLHAPL